MRLNTIVKVVVIFGMVIAPIISAIASDCNAPKLDEYSGIGWTKDSLDGEDASFRQIRQQIDSQVSKGVNASDLAKRYKVIAQQNPSDAEVMFSWAYAAYIASDHWNRNVRATKEFCGIYEWMGKPKNPKSFEYARLRLFMSRFSEQWISYGNYADLARHLLSKGSKKDFDLRYFAINAIASNIGSKTPELIDEVFELVLQLRKDFPKRPETLYLLGGIYSSRFAVSKRDQLANFAIQHTHEYLATKPNNSAMVRSAKSRIKLVERLRKKFKERGELN